MDEWERQADQLRVAKLESSYRKRLEAAAPELLAACESLLEETKGQAGWSTLTSVLEAAIAKAKGTLPMKCVVFGCSRADAEKAIQHVAREMAKGFAESEDTVYCPAHGARRKSLGEASQKEIEETCGYVCASCGAECHRLPF